MIKLYRTTLGLLAEREGHRWLLPSHNQWDDLLARPDVLTDIDERTPNQALPSAEIGQILPPIMSQEVWAAGVTYLRSREARVEESKAGGGGAGAGDFYERVYSAARPELFFKATAHRVVGPGQQVHIRGDSRWNVPEPELACLVNSRGRIVGYTIGNDMSSRDIEGENPLYLPQAKVYDGCCALGPCVVIQDEPLPRSTAISMSIRRSGETVFAGNTSLSQIKRGFQELVEYLFRDNSFPHGCYLLTGTGVVPPDSFTLKSGDEISISIDPIGVLQNTVR